MAFEWMEELPQWQRDLRDGLFALVAALVIAVPMIMVRHKAALKAAHGKMD